MNGNQLWILATIVRNGPQRRGELRHFANMGWIEFDDAIRSLERGGFVVREGHYWIATLAGQQRIA